MKIILALGLGLLLCSHSQARTFGYRGYDGRDGTNGSHGQNGSNYRLHVVPGQFQSLDLSGRDGGRGGDGEDGDHAWSCFQPRDNNDEKGADGGNGGDAGEGGLGGNAGMLTLYYQNQTDLNNIYVRSVPGRGGEPGRRGWGGRACRCSTYNWTGSDGNNYRCYDGQDGYNGSSAYRGADGSGSVVVFINRAQELVREKNDYAANLGSHLGINLPIYMNDHVWRGNSGLLQALSTNSYLERASGVEYVRTDFHQVTMDWESATDESSFLNDKLQLHFENQKLSVRPVSPLWPIMRTHLLAPGQTHITITDAVHSTSAEKINITELSGLESSVKLDLLDSADSLDRIDYKFYLNYKTRVAGIIYTTRWEGDVPSSLINRNGSKLTIKVGQLPIPSKYLKWGRKVLIELTVKRSFGPNQLSYVREIKQRLL